MTTKSNTAILLALSASILSIMLTSVLFFVPTPSRLEANLAGMSGIHDSGVSQSSISNNTILHNQILAMIHTYVANNQADAAKKLYDELHLIQLNP